MPSSAHPHRSRDAQGATTAKASAAPWGRPLIGELLDTIPDPVIGCDAAGRVVHWSNAAADAYGYTEREAIGRPVVTLLRTRFPIPLMEIMEEVTDLGRWQGILVHRAKDGGEHTVDSRWVSRYDEAGRLVGGFGIERELLGLDELGRRQAPNAPAERLERELERAERLDGLGQMAGAVAHDFNNELAIILNYAAFVASELETAAHGPGGERFAAMAVDLGEIQTAASRAAKSTRQLLAFSRQGLAASVSLDLNDTIDEIAELLRRTAGHQVRLVLHLAPQLPQVDVDPVQIDQVLVHLAANAGDAMPLGGTLTIDTADLEVDEAGAAWTDEVGPGHYVRLRVSDTGTGMASNVLERAFDPFFTTKPVGKGTGLGLSGVYGIVTRAGGRVHLHSEPGVGTTFVALLPACRDAVAPLTAGLDRVAGRQVAREPKAVAAGATVLVVDDERALRDVAARILVRCGYDVITAANGEEALVLAADRPDPIDVLLTDMVMPGMLGSELAEAMRRVRPEISVVYMSGFAPALLAGATQGSDTELIDKPFTAATLVEGVRAALARSSA